MNDSAAVQRAVDTGAAAGGGRSVVSVGRTITAGLLRLRSHVELHPERGAVLKGSPQHREYTITIPCPVQLDPAARDGSKHFTPKPGDRARPLTYE